MYSTILTELGIAIFDGDKCLKAFPFKNSAEEYILVKKGESKLSELGKFFTNGNGTIVNDRGLLDILKKKSVDVQLMDVEQLDDIRVDWSLSPGGTTHDRLVSHSTHHLSER